MLACLVFFAKFYSLKVKIYRYLNSYDQSRVATPTSSVRLPLQFLLPLRIKMQPCFFVSRGNRTPGSHCNAAVASP